MIIINRRKVSQGTDTTTKKRRRKSTEVGLEDRIVIGHRFNRRDVTKNVNVIEHLELNRHDVQYNSYKKSGKEKRLISISIVQQQLLS